MPVRVRLRAPKIIGSVQRLRSPSHLTSCYVLSMNAKTWPAHDAKARFSEMLDACVRDGPQVVTKVGEETAVLVSEAQMG